MENSKTEIPEDLEGHKRLDWALRKEGFKPDYVSRVGKFSLDDKPCDSKRIAFIRCQLEQKYYYVDRDKNGNPKKRDLKFQDSEFNQYLDAIKHENDHDPVLEYFESLKSLAKPLKVVEELLGTWLMPCMGIEDNDLNRYICTLIICGPLIRTYYPGSIIKHYPVLVGPSQVGKSTLVAELLPSHLQMDYIRRQVNFNQNPREIYYDLKGKCVVEMGEMSGMTKTAESKLKNQLDQPGYSGRMVYERETTTHLFTHFFIGTANPERPFLPRDQVAAERFLPMKVTKEFENIREYMKSNLDDLYAAGKEYLRLKGGASAFKVVPKYVRAAHSLSVDKYKYDPLESAREQINSWVEKWLKGEAPAFGDWFSMADLRMMIFSDQSGMDQRVIRDSDFGTLLTESGFDKIRRGNRRLWVPPHGQPG